VDCDFFRSEKKLQQARSALHNPPGTQTVVRLSWRTLEGLKDCIKKRINKWGYSD